MSGNHEIGHEQIRAAALLDAQAKAAALFSDIERMELIRPGATESELNKAIFRLSRDKYDAGRHWHKRIVRAGPNTMLPYQHDPEDRVIEANDIVFVDLGPVFAEWEADFGRTYVLGSDPGKQRICRMTEAIFRAGKKHFAAHPDITGAELYAYVRGLAESEGWEFGNAHAGHLVGEFPHERIHGDQVTLYIHGDNHDRLRQLDKNGHERHWILEVHLVDRERQYGAFFEELLTLGEVS